MKFNFVRLAILAAICIATVPALMAVPVNPCPNIALATTYVNTDGSSNNFSCIIGNLEFSNFSFAGSNITASDVSVSRLTDPGNQGLMFTGAFDVGGNGDPKNMDVNIAFTITALTGVIDDLQIDLLAADIGNGTGHIHYVEQFCGATIGCNIFVDDPGTSTLTSELKLSSPVTSLTVDKDLSLHANNGTASVSAFDNRYSNTVPEPRAISFALGLVVLCGAAFMKRRQAARG